jgi:HlyD family secretion protein
LFCRRGSLIFKFMKHKKLIIAGLVVLLLIDMGLAYKSYQNNKNPNYETIAVRKGDIVERVSSIGAVESANQINLGFTTAGRIVDVKVKTGDRVSAGQILASQDSSDLIFQAQGAGAALESAAAKLAQLLAGSSAEEIAVAQTAAVNAQKNLDDTRASLSDAEALAKNSLNDAYQDGQRTLDTSLLALQNSLQSNTDTLEANKLAGVLSLLNPGALTDAKTQKTSADADYAAVRILAERSRLSLKQEDIDQAIEELRKALNSGYDALGHTYDALVATPTSSNISQAELDAYKTIIAAARTSLNTALTNLIAAFQSIASQRIANQTNLNTAQAKVTTAEGALATAKNQLSLKIAKPRQADIDLYQAQVRQAQASLSQIRNLISQKSIVSPIDGVITSLSFEKGEIVSPGQLAIAMNSLANFEIKSNIVESDIKKVKIGDPADITFDAFGEESVWNGRVVKIDPAQTVVQGVVYYTTTIALSGDDSQIKSGMTANLDIETDRHSDAVIIPIRSFKEAGGKKTAQLLENKNQMKEVEITTGLKDENGLIEVLSGLKEGQTIVIEKIK